MHELLKAHDPELIDIDCGDGGVLVCPGLQGRVFCEVGGELIHRLDTALLKNPSTKEYNNLGGNSLWPAPEGGSFAFNYPPNSDQWYVQPGIAEAKPTVSYQDPLKVVIEKRIELTNRRGARIDLLYVRSVSTPPETWHAGKGFDLRGLTYRTEETFEPLGSYNADEVLLAPWSLEQFPGAEGVTAFCKVKRPEQSINDDFYGPPEGRISYGKGYFTFVLGGPDRHQIGIRVAEAPELIGALDTNRSMLMLRRTDPQEGTYFNIADNEQPQGPYSDADLYSIFNGGALGFFELETVGAMQSTDGKVAKSTLVSETTLLQGSLEELKRYLVERTGIRIS